MRSSSHPIQNKISAAFTAVLAAGLLAACSASEPENGGGSDGAQTFCENIQANEALFGEVLALGETGGLLDSDLSTPPATLEEMVAAVPTFTNLNNAATVLLESAPDDVEQYVKTLQFMADEAVLRLPQGDGSSVSSAVTAIKAIDEWAVANCASSQTPAAEPAPADDSSDPGKPSGDRICQAVADTDIESLVGAAIARYEPSDLDYASGGVRNACQLYIADGTNIGGVIFENQSSPMGSVESVASAPGGIAFDLGGGAACAQMPCVVATADAVLTLLLPYTAGGTSISPESRVPLVTNIVDNLGLR